jgi:hypothetical protein
MLTPKDVTPRILAVSPIQCRVGRDCEVSTPPTYVYVSIVANHVPRQLELQEGHFVYWPFPCSCIGVP